MPAVSGIFLETKYKIIINAITENIPITKDTKLIFSIIKKITIIRVIVPSNDSINSFLTILIPLLVVY